MNYLIPSATVILLNANQSDSGFDVLLLQRNSKLATHGGAWVFPGGKIDSQDYEGQAANFYQLGECAKLATAQKAASRELIEEAGIKLGVNEMSLCSTWLTPPTMSKRFDAWFFLAETPTSEVSIDEGEIHDSMWISPEEALAKQKKGEISLPPPTFVSLLYLSRCTSISQAFEQMCEIPRHFKPRLASVKGGFCSLYEEDDGYTTADPNVRKKMHRLAMIDGMFEYIKTI